MSTAVRRVGSGMSPRHGGRWGLEPRPGGRGPLGSATSGRPAGGAMQRGAGVGGLVSFPASGVPWEALREEMVAAKAADVAWRRGRSPAYVHFGGEDVLAVSKAAFDLFFTENALGRQAFPSLARFEREIVGVSLDLLGGPARGAGAGPPRRAQ